MQRGPKPDGRRSTVVTDPGIASFEVNMVRFPMPLGVEISQEAAQGHKTSQALSSATHQRATTLEQKDRMLNASYMAVAKSNQLPLVNLNVCLAGRRTCPVRDTVCLHKAGEFLCSCCDEIRGSGRC